jgi:hypothetical protein
VDDDSESTAVGTAIDIDVIANDPNVTSSYYSYQGGSVTTQPSIVSGNGVTDAGTATDVKDTNGDKTGVIRYQPAPGFVGTVQFIYTLKSQKGTVTVSVTAIAVVENIFEKSLAVSSQGASDQANDGLRGAAALTAGGPSSPVIESIIKPVTVTGTADFVSNTSQAAVQFNFAQSLTDFLCNMPWSNCNNERGCLLLIVECRDGSE